MRSFRNDSRMVDKQVPKWNLNLVLNALTKPPFEPLLRTDLKYASWKAVFLTAFSTAARVSELQALSNSKFKHSENWDKVTVETSDHFIAKNQDLMIESKPRSFHIPALFDYAGPDLPDRFLCPVRALRIYRYRTKPRRSKQQRKLFISFDANHQKDITANTISAWIKNTIKLAYKLSSDDQALIHQVSAHEVRALASSVAFSHNLSLQDINRSCYWRGHSTFTQYYLRDIAMATEGTLHMPSVVAAGTKVIK